MKQTLPILFGLMATAVIAADVSGYAYWSSASLKGYAAKLAPKMNAGKSAAEPLADWGNHLAMVSYREADGEAEVHEKVVDIFVAQAGAATVVVGGKTVEPRNTGAGEIRGKTIQGGVRQKMAPGDVVHIPQNTPHQVLVEKGKSFTYFVIKVNQ